ncbi:alpha-E domain-containing protein [Paraflavisolibacter sp. H34]|uniref:alpha-E domain-containing protein n=1 Tax=Huijunlia imazamoxiresistens TaxID=3127457 RepID=UPI00301B117B
MLSRIADSLFWLSRYMERADGLLRLTSTHYIFSLDKDLNGYLSWKPVLELFSAAGEHDMPALEKDTEGVLRRLLIDHTNANSLKMVVHRARENARGVQDHITMEVWREVNQMYHTINQPSLQSRLNTFDAMEVMEVFTRHCLVFAGVTSTTMPRGTGWDFMNLGKYLERSLQTIAFLQNQLKLVRSGGAEPNDILHWRYLLLSLSGYELHLKSYQNSQHTFNVMHQVVLNESFSRSIMYSLHHTAEFLHRVTNKEDGDGAHLLRCFGRLHSKVTYMDLKVLTEQGLEDFLEELTRDLQQFNTLLGQYFFSYS